MEFEGYTAANHFVEIVDLWNDCWNEKRGTVMPDRVNEAYDGREPAVIHYIQPHRPLLNLESDGLGNRKKTLGKSKLTSKIRRFLNDSLLKVMSTRRAKSLVTFLKGKVERGGYEFFVDKYGAYKVVEEYEENLETALKSVSNLISHLSNKEIVITSDHGEAFGEKAVWGHRPESDLDCLRNVPWFWVE